MLKKRHVLIILVAMISLSFISACANENTGEKNEITNTDQSSESNSSTEVNKSAGEIQYLNTKNVTRLNSDDPFVTSVLVARTIWPATHSENKPGTIILAPLEDWKIALASLNLVHHPNDGPLLFTDNGSIPEIILNELERLQPKGNVEGTQVMVMGSLNEGELDKLADYDVIQIEETDPAAFTFKIDELYTELTQSLPNSVIIGSLEEDAKEYTIVGGSWITHMDEPLLYISEDEIPKETIAALEKRNGGANIYVLGPKSIISKKLEKQLSEYGEVIRIQGKNPAELSIEFAKFKDTETNFGWGITNPGHGLVMVSNSIPELAITSAPFAHLGKHAPMVWLDGGEFTEEMHEYLAQLKPSFENDPTEGPYNHAYLIGNEKLVSFNAQGYIDDMLEITPANGDGDGGHGGHGQ